MERLSKTREEDLEEADSWWERGAKGVEEGGGGERGGFGGGQGQWRGGEGVLVGEQLIWKEGPLHPMELSSAGSVRPGAPSSGTRQAEIKGYYEEEGYTLGSPWRSVFWYLTARGNGLL